MYPAAFEYHAPKTVKDALKLLGKLDDAKLLAGGHSLVPMMKLRLAQPKNIIDLRNVSGLTGIKEEKGVIAVGAMTTHWEVESSKALKSKAAVVSETAAIIGDPAVRNKGTLGGSLAHADPAADYPTALLALGAEVETGGAVARRIPVGEFFKGLFATALERGEIVVAVHVPVGARGTGACYEKHRHPASSYAVVGVAALVTVAGGVCKEARLAVGGATANPARARAAEAALTGKKASAEAFAGAAAAVAGALAEPLSDLYASGEFRIHLATVLARRALAAAAARAGA
jgi:carbon-monoxide dehydrogenase medium subunit